MRNGCREERRTRLPRRAHTAHTEGIGSEAPHLQSDLQLSCRDPLNEYRRPAESPRVTGGQSARSRRLCSHTNFGRPAGVRVLPDRFCRETSRDADETVVAGDEGER